MISKLVKKLGKNTPLYPIFCTLRAKRTKRRRDREERAQWERQGRPAPPPPVVKQEVVRRYAKQYGLTVFVETGTFLGDMVAAVKGDFDQIYSIELGDELYENAKSRFASDKHITLLHGDSGLMIKQILAELNRPALFWLDAHFSAGITARGEQDTPIWDELNHVLSAPDLGHVILIDDARMFGSDVNYPTISKLKEFVNSKRASNITIEYDSIRIVPAGRTDVV